MANEQQPEKPKTPESESGPEPPPIETSGGQFVGETEESMQVPADPQGQPWWSRLWDRIRGR